jgi:hypothetical protein
MRIVSLALVFLASTVGCSGYNPFAPDQSVILDVSKIDAPAAVAATNPITVVLTVTLGGCLSFDHIEVSRDASNAHIIVWGRDAAKGKTDVACPANLELRPYSYEFDPPFANTFTVQAARGRLAPLQTTIQVQ